MYKSNFNLNFTEDVFIFILMITTMKIKSNNL